MRATIIAVILVLIAAAGCCCQASAADKKAEPVTVVYKEEGKKIELKSFEIGIDDEGLLGTTYKKLKKLPVKADKLKVEVSLDNLAKIEFLSVGKDGKDIKVKLTAVDGKTMEGTVDNEKKIIWKGVLPFADAEATLDPADIKEIVLKPEK